MLINAATLQGLRTTVDLTFAKAFEQAETVWQQLATKVPSTTDTQTYGWLADSLDLREWVGPRVSVAMAEHEYTLKNLEWERTIRIPRKHILDDNLGIWTSMLIPQFGIATAKHPDRQLSAIIKGNPTGFDGLPFFDNAHSTFAEGGGTYDNDFTLALTSDNVDEVWSAMTSVNGESGHPMGVDARTLIVPPQLRRVAREIAKSTSVIKVVQNVAGNENVAATTIDNVDMGDYNIIVWHDLADEPTRWYLADLSKPIKPFIWQVRSEPVLRSFDTGSERESFESNEYTWGIDGSDGGPYRANGGVSLPFLCSRSTPP